MKGWLSVEDIKPFRAQEVLTEMAEADGGICSYIMIVLPHRSSISLIRRVSALCEENGAQGL